MQGGAQSVGVRRGAEARSCRVVRARGLAWGVLMGGAPGLEAPSVSIRSSDRVTARPIARCARALRLGLALPLAMAAACTVQGMEPDELAGEDDELVGDPDAELPFDLDTSGWVVDDAVTRVCTTSVVAPLAEQLIEELECMRPGTTARIDGLPGVTLAKGTRPYLQGAAAQALATAARSTAITLNSGLRTLPQQFLLYQWYRRGLCKNVVRLAARPGRSNHESGVALDVGNHAAARTALRNQGYTWFGSRDPVHFDYKAGTDLRGLSVRAFQRLWNLNNPGDTIAVDGDYGPQTESAMKRSPVNGFATGSTCAAPSPLLVDLDWSQQAGGLLEVRAGAPAGVAAVELWLGGELLAVMERDADGRFGADLELLEPGTLLLEAVALDLDGRRVGAALDYIDASGGLAALGR